MKNFKLFLTLLTLVIFGSGQMWGVVSGTYNLASSVSAGDVIIIVNADNTYALKSLTTGNKPYGEYSSVTCSDGVITLSNANVEELNVVTGNANGSFSFQGTAAISGYLNHSGSNNTLNSNAQKSNNTSWTIAIDATSKDATIANVASTTRVMRFNTNSGQERFACYTSATGTLVHIFKKQVASCSNKVNISAGTPETGGSFNLSKTGNQDCCSALTVNVTDITAPSGKQFSTINQSGIDAENVTIDNNAKTVTYAANSNGSSTINVTFENLPTHIVTWSANGNTSNTSTVAEGAAITFPKTAIGCDGGTFMGWASEVIDGTQASAPTYVTSANMGNSDITYYAVFANVSDDVEEDTDTERGSTSSPYVANTGWSATAGGTYTTSGNYGNASPSIKMSTDGNYVQSPTYSGAITAISYWYKPQNATGSISTFVSTDGTNWTELTQEAVSFSSSSTASTKSITVSSSSGYKAVKIVYNKTNSNVAIDDIAITYEEISYSDYRTTCCQSLGTINGSVSKTTVPTQNSVTIEWDNVSGASNWAVACKQGGSAYNAAQVGEITDISNNTRKQCTISNLAAGTAYTFTVSADLTGYCTSSVSEDVAGSTAAAYTITAESNNTAYGTVSGTSTITATPAEGYRVSKTTPYTVSPANSATVNQNGNTFTVTPIASTTVTINFEVIPTRQISFNTGGLVSIDPVDVKEDVTRDITETPAASLSENCTYSTFVGWTLAESIEDETVCPDIVTSVTMGTSNITLRAVYSAISMENKTDKTASVTIFDYASAHSWSNETKYSTVTLDANITATADGGGNTGKYYTNGTEWRFYQTETPTLTISAAANCILNSATFTYKSANTGVLLDGETQVESGSECTISGTSKEFSVGNSGTATNGQVKFTAISVDYSVGTPIYSMSTTCDVIVRTLKSIAVSGMTTMYEVNEAFSFDGTCTATYGVTINDEPQLDETEEVEPTSVSSPTMSAAGNQTITVTYGEVSTTYDISVLNLQTITITQDKIASFAASYDDYTWTAGGVSGTVHAYKNSGMQFNSSNGSYIYNTDAVPGHIRKIIITKASGNTRSWTPYVSTTAMTETDAEKALDSKNVDGTSSWVLTGSNRYFYLTNTGGATTIESFVIKYEPQSYVVTLDVNDNKGSVKMYDEAIENEIASGTSIAEGTKVVLEATAENGYKLDHWALSEDNGGAALDDASSTTPTLTIGTAAVTATAYFVAEAQKHNVTIVSNTNGTIKVNDATTTPQSIEEGATVTVTLSGITDNYHFVSWSILKETDAESVEDISVDPTTHAATFTMPESAVEVSVTIEEDETFAVHYYVNGVEDTNLEDLVYDGQTVTLPSAPAAYDQNYPNFVGWSTTSTAKMKTAPSIVTGSEPITAETSYYAVFANAATSATNNYQKIDYTATLNGNYIIAAYANSTYNAMRAEMGQYNLSSTTVTVDNNVINTEETLLVWNITQDANTNYVKLKNGSNWASIVYDGSHTNLILTSTDAANQFTVAENNAAENAYVFETTESIERDEIEYHNGYTAYNGQDAPIYLFKQILSPTEWITRQAVSYDVTYHDNVDDAEIEVPNVDVATENEDYIVSSFEPVRQGYTFVGWNTDKDANSGINKVENVQDDVDLYAIWTPNHTTTIKFYAINMTTPIATYAQTQGVEYVIPNMSTSLPAAPEGFTFVGWSASQIDDEAAAYTQVTSVTPDVAEADNEMSLYAVYNREVIGSGNYVKVTTARVDWSGQYLIVNEENNVAFNGNLTGDALSGTSTTISVSISENTIAQSTSMDNASFTFAQVDGGYSIQSHSGYYIGRNSSSTGMDVTDTYSAAYKNTIDVDEIAANNEYLLRYNAANDQKRFRYYSRESVKGIALYRKDDVENNYTTNPVVKYDITYLAGDAENVTGICDADRQVAGEITLCAAPTSSNKNFDKWSDGTSLYDADATYNLTGNVTFTATWTAKSTYTVTYTANGGTGTAPEVEEYLEDATVTVKANSYFSKPGFVYAGWQVVYNDGTDHIITPNEDGEFEMVAYNVTIKALWEEPSNQKWVRVETTDDLMTDGTIYIIVGAESDVAMGSLNGSFYNSVGIVKTGNYLNGPESMTKITLENGSATGKFAIKHGSKYIHSGIAKSIGEQDAASDWTITIADGVATIKTGTGDGWYLKYNSKDPRFNTYASGQQTVAIYREKALKVIEDVNMTEEAVNTNDDVELAEDSKWTINNDKTVGDVHFKDGAIIANTAATVTTQDVYFKARHGKSNQIFDLSKITVTGSLYYDFQLCDGDLDPNYWYSISVPFDVDLTDGVFQVGGTTPLVNHSDFEVWGYNTSKRAQTQSNGWERVTDNMMHAGKAYLIGFNPGQPNVIRLKAAANWNLFNGGTSMSVESTGSGVHDNWNGLANPTGRYIDVDVDAQAFNNNTHGWDSYALDATRYNFVVGTAFFVQTSSAVTISNTDHGNYRAPQRAGNKFAYAVQITREGATAFDNQMIVRASEDATNAYEQGHDMLTMNNATSNTAALLWTENYGGKRLAIEEAPLVNNQAMYDLRIYAPAAGTYSLSAAAKEGADLYVTYEGAIVWNLSLGDYELDLVRGTTTGYGLLLVVQPNQMPTGVENGELLNGENGVQKILLNGQLYILRDGHLYDAVGHKK